VHNRDIRLESIGEVVGIWDRDRLSQLLSNLVANASQHGTPDTLVLIRLDGSAPDRVRFEVRNSGVIPPDILPVIFEPLRQSEAQAKRQRSSGLGLGLYITQQIALAHGGTIHVESSEPEGTCFTVELTRRPSAEIERGFSPDPHASASAPDEAGAS